MTFVFFFFFKGKYRMRWVFLVDKNLIFVHSKRVVVFDFLERYFLRSFPCRF